MVYRKAPYMVLYRAQASFAIAKVSPRLMSLHTNTAPLRFHASRRLLPVWVAALVLGALRAGSVPPGVSNTGTTDPAGMSSYGDLLQEYANPDWKAPSWFHRPEKDDPASQLAYAQSLEASGRTSSACAEYNALVHKWSSSPEAPKAQYALARLYDRLGKKARAFKEYQYALLMYPNAIPYQEAVDSQMALLRAMEGELGTGFLGMGQTMDADDIARLYQIVAINAPSGEFAPECYFRMGELYSGRHSRRYDLSLEPYETVVVRYPESDLAPLAAFRAARARVLLSRKYPRDEKRTRSALLSIDAVLSSYAPLLPNAEAARAELVGWRKEVADRLSHTEFQKAEFYDTIRHKPESAIVAYRRFLEVHPDSPDAAQARRRLSELTAKAP